MPNLYETLLIVTPEADDEGINAVVGDLRSLIDANGGSVLQARVWDRNRKLAYPVQGKTEGHYVILHAEGSGDLPQALKQRMRLDESVIRYIVVRLEDKHEEVVRKECAEHEVDQSAVAAEQLAAAERRAEAAAAAAVRTVAEVAAEEAAEAEVEGGAAEEPEEAAEGGAEPAEEAPAVAPEEAPGVAPEEAETPAEADVEGEPADTAERDVTAPDAPDAATVPPEVEPEPPTADEPPAAPGGDEPLDEEAADDEDKEV